MGAFDVATPRIARPEVLRRLDTGQTADAALALPAGVEQALGRVFACRSGADGLNAGPDAEACPPALRFAARADDGGVVDPFAFFDLDLRLAGRALDAPPRGPATALAPGRDARLSSADEMRDRLPPSAPDPAFGD